MKLNIHILFRDVGLNEGIWIKRVGPKN